MNYAKRLDPSTRKSGRIGHYESTEKKVNVFIVSDATGITAEMVAGAALVQFRQVEPIFKRFPNVKTEEQIKDILMTVLSTTMGMLLMALKGFHHLWW